MKTKRYIFTLLLLLSWILPICVISLKYQGQLHVARTKAVEQIKRSDGDQERIWLKFSISDAESKLDWEHEREFEYLGQMYDVISSVMEGDSILFYCYPDRHETYLKREFKNMLASLLSPVQQSREQSQHTKDFMKSIYCVHGADGVSVAMQPGNSTMNHYFSMLTEFLLEPGIPPPRVV